MDYKIGYGFVTHKIYKTFMASKDEPTASTIKFWFVQG
jgi:hypothetical protein